MTFRTAWLVLDSRGPRPVFILLIRLSVFYFQDSSPLKSLNLFQHPKGLFINKRRPQSGMVGSSSDICGQRGFLSCGRPHVSVQKTLKFS